MIDTNAVLEELMFLVRSRKNPSARTNLQEAIDSGAVAAFAPSKLREEVARHIPRLAVERGIPEEALAHAWRQYESRIKYVDVGPVSDVGAGEVADPDDLPFVYLYREINADAVLTRDRSISLMGAQSVQLEALIHVREYARVKAPEVTLRAGAVVVTVPVAIVGQALWGLSKAAVRKFSGLPKSLPAQDGHSSIQLTDRARVVLPRVTEPSLVVCCPPGALAFSERRAGMGGVYLRRGVR